MFTDSHFIVSAWLDVDLITRLLLMAGETEFNVMSEAIQTCQHLFLTERKNNQQFMDFIKDNKEPILDMFKDFYELMINGQKEPSS